MVSLVDKYPGMVESDPTWASPITENSSGSGQSPGTTAFDFGIHFTLSESDSLRFSDGSRSIRVPTQGTVFLSLVCQARPGLHYGNHVARCQIHSKPSVITIKGALAIRGIPIGFPDSVEDGIALLNEACHGRWRRQGDSRGLKFQFRF